MMREYKFFVYILLCADNTYYIGVTNNLDRRISEHNSGEVEGFTSSRLPVHLLKSFGFNDIRLAIAFEKQIKNWSRKKKEALINEEWKTLSKLAKRRTPNKTRI